MGEEKTIVYSYNKDTKTYTISDKEMQKINRKLKERFTLRQENQQLKEKINTYEKPEDLTLMFMYCDEKAKDKINQLKEVIEEVREYINEKIKFNDDQIKEYKTCITTNINGKFSEETKDNMERSVTILMSVNCKMRGILQILDKEKDVK